VVHHGGGQRPAHAPHIKVLRVDVLPHVPKRFDKQSGRDFQPRRGGGHSSALLKTQPFFVSFGFSAAKRTTTNRANRTQPQQPLADGGCYVLQRILIQIHLTVRVKRIAG